MKPPTDHNILIKKALNLLAIKDYTVSEMQHKLSKYGDSGAVVKVLEWLEHKGWLNDMTYVEHYMSYGVQQARGYRVLKQKLMTKGIDEALIEVYQDALIEEQIAYAQQYGQRLLSKTKLSAMLFKQDLKKRLYNRGYSADIIATCIHHLEDMEVETEQLNAINLFNKLWLAEKRKQKAVDETKIIKKMMAKGFSYAYTKELIEGVDDNEND